MKPITITQAVEEYSNFDPETAVFNEMTNDEIREYFTPESFINMFGHSDEHPDSETGWNWDWNELADCAIELCDDLR